MSTIIQRMKTNHDQCQMQQNEFINSTAKENLSDSDGPDGSTVSLG